MIPWERIQMEIIAKCAFLLARKPVKSKTVMSEIYNPRLKLSFGK